MTEPQKMTPEQEMGRSHNAQRILGDPLFQEACREIEAALSEQRRNAPIGDKELHQLLILNEQILYRFLDFFRFVVQTGELAKVEVDRKDALKERVKRMLTLPLRGF